MSEDLKKVIHESNFDNSCFLRALSMRLSLSKFITVNGVGHGRAAKYELNSPCSYAPTLRPVLNSWAAST